MLVKTVQFRENLKQLLEAAYGIGKTEPEPLILDYYGKLFKIVPIKSEEKEMTQMQRIIQKYSNLPPRKLSFYSLY